MKPFTARRLAPLALAIAGAGGLAHWALMRSEVAPPSSASADEGAADASDAAPAAEPRSRSGTLDGADATPDPSSVDRLAENADEARLADRGDANRQALIETQTRRLTALADRAERDGHPERARLMRARVRALEGLRAD